MNRLEAQPPHEAGPASDPAPSLTPAGEQSDFRECCDGGSEAPALDELRRAFPGAAVVDCDCGPS